MSLCNYFYRVIARNEGRYKLFFMKHAKEKSKRSAKNPLRAELETYQKQGVELWLDGQPSTPKSICRACKVAEEGTYMRDYVNNPEGSVQSLGFYSVKKRK